VKKLLLLCALFGFPIFATAQSDRQAIEFYTANFEKYLGQEIGLMVAEVTRQDKGQHGDVAVFSIYTKGARESAFTHAVVPLSEAKSFSNSYAFRDYKTRLLRGTLRQTGSGDFYISYKGAELPSDTPSAATEEPTASGKSEDAPVVAFDDKPMSNFSYDGARLIEARITGVGSSGVTVVDKHNTSVTVPLEQAVKMPDLRMRAKAAIETALAEAN
jgi:hypothetical protein